MRLSRILGFSLIEVLISLLLISLILLGLDAMQYASLRQIKETYFLHVASNQLQNLKERLFVSQQSPQIFLWNEENKKVLPAGFGTLSGEFPNYILTIYWGKKTHQCKKNQLGESGCLIEKIHVASHS